MIRRLRISFRLAVLGLLTSPAALAGTHALAAEEGMSLASPLDRQVVQRDANQCGAIGVSGSLTVPAEVVEAEAELAAGATRGKAVDWTVVTKGGQIKDGKFAGSLVLPSGGWYRLLVRARNGGQTVAEARLERVGVGDVYVTAGQSNSANFGQTRQAAKDDRVVYFDGKAYVPAKDPIPGGFGGGGSPWPILGDLLARHWNVPICFRSSTLTYTPVSDWLPDAKHDQYSTLVKRIKEMGPRGVRAVLWHQGESDSLAKTTAEQYRDRLTQVIKGVRKDVGYETDWFVAQASFHPGCNKDAQAPVAAGQKLIWESKSAFPGPVTDDLLGKEYRSDGVHFTVKGLQEHAERWQAAIVRQYGKL